MKHRGLHNLLVVLLLALTCLAITGAVVTVWLHQTVLNTDRFVGVVSDVTADPAVVDSLSQRLATQIVAGVGVEERVSAILPDSLDRLAEPVTEGLNQRMATAIAAALASPAFRSVWPSLIGTAHERLLAFLRTDTAQDGGTMSVDLVCATGTAFDRLKEDGVLPDVVVPSISMDMNRATVIARINAAFGTSVPADFGEIQLTSGPKIQQLAAAVRGWDLITIGFVVFSLGLGLVTIWMVDRRWRGVLVLLVSVAVAMAILMLLLSVVSARAAEAIASSDGRVAVEAIVTRLSGSLFGWLALVLLATLLIAGSIYALRHGRDVSRQETAPPPSPAI